jgi:CubicO group peptidase (beta-lactamase class C family)
LDRRWAQWQFYSGVELDIPTLAGAGALRSTANDMLNFLAAYLSYIKTPLAEAMAEQISIRRPAKPNFDIAYAWRVRSRDGNTIFWHGGTTGGYRSYVGFDLEARTGVVVLANNSTLGTENIGHRLLNPSRR